MNLWFLFSLLIVCLSVYVEAGGKKSESIIVINNQGGGCGKSRANTIVTTSGNGKGKGKKGKGKGHKIILTSGGGGHGGHKCSERKSDIRRQDSTKFQFYPVPMIQSPFYPHQHPVAWSHWFPDRQH